MSDRFPSATVATAAQQGMVRIHRGAELRYVWPVHLAGWLSSGWRTGEEQRPPQGAAAAQAIHQRPGAEAPLAVLTGTPPAAPEPQTAVLAGPDREPLDAHLPTNLLDLDLEPEVQPAASIIAAATAAAPAEVSSQNDSERNDAGSASFAGGDHAAGAPAGIEGLVADAASLDAPAEPALEEVTAAAAATDPSPEAHQASAPQQTQAPTRRGRPRKGRQEAQPEAQPELGTETVAETPEQEQPSASKNTGDQQNPASLLFSAGDDPFGDPLL
ncbi:MAG: hypothetical protein WCI65_07065 [Synechococcaceae cyanobacterium ELA263]